MLTDFIRFSLNRIRSKGITNYISGLIRYVYPKAPVGLLVELKRRKYENASPKLKIVQIETITGCNYSCSFCPINIARADSGRMEIDLYKKIIKDLVSFDGEIHLFFRGDPLIDKRIHFFCRYAAENTPARIILQTNGALLTETLAKELLNYCEIFVNDYTDDHCVIDRVQSWRCKKKITLIPRRATEILSNRAGNINRAVEIPLRAFCERPFEQMTISYDGRVVLCCQDWARETTLGNVSEDALTEIWTNPVFLAKRAELLRRERFDLCARCDFPGT